MRRLGSAVALEVCTRCRVALKSAMRCRISSRSQSLSFGLAIGDMATEFGGSTRVGVSIRTGLTAATLCANARVSSINRSRSLIHCITARPHAKRALQQRAWARQSNLGLVSICIQQGRRGTISCCVKRPIRVRRLVPLFAIQLKRLSVTILRW
jgi:hypothetical protein